MALNAIIPGIDHQEISIGQNRKAVGSVEGRCARIAIAAQIAPIGRESLNQIGAFVSDVDDAIGHRQRQRILQWRDAGVKLNNIGLTKCQFAAHWLISVGILLGTSPSPTPYSQIMAAKSLRM